MKPFVAILTVLGVSTSLVASEPNKSSTDDLYQLGKQLFDQYAPAEVKAQYDFPSREEADKTLVKLQEALDGGSFKELAQYESQAQLILTFLKTIPEQADTTDWLESRMDEIEEAKAATLAPAVIAPQKQARLESPVISAVPSKPLRGTEQIPYYAQWLVRAKNKTRTNVDPRLIKTLQKAFEAEGVPPQLIWIAEAESSMNPSARSPSGARGLFQLKSDTAKEFGLSTFLPDDRTDPSKSARAAARYLKQLGNDLGSWPLALAGYNAGESRVKKLLESRHAKTYAQIADSLPAGTRMYVPKVFSIVEVRTGTSLDHIPRPN